MKDRTPTAEELEAELDKLQAELKLADSCRKIILIIDKVGIIKRKAKDLEEIPEKLHYKMYHFLRQPR